MYMHISTYIHESRTGIGKKEKKKKKKKKKKKVRRVTKQL